MRHSRAMRRSKGAPGPEFWLGLSCLWGCVQSQVVSLAVPPLACPDQRISIEWEAIGRASLRAARAKNDWQEMEVPSRGRLQLMAVQTTMFTLRALDAKASRKSAYRSATLQVPLTEQDRAVRASCDEDGRCRGSFVLPEVSMMKVVKLSEPTLVVGGQAQALALCVTPPPGGQSCLEPAASTAIDTPATGTWTLEARLPPEQMPPEQTPPPQLRIHLGLRCL
jgi:hypothetical protein